MRSTSKARLRMCAGLPDEMALAKDRIRSALSMGRKPLRLIDTDMDRQIELLRKSVDALSAALEANERKRAMVSARLTLSFEETNRITRANLGVAE